MNYSIYIAFGNDKMIGMRNKLVVARGLGSRRVTCEKVVVDVTIKGQLILLIDGPFCVLTVVIDT